MRSIGKAAVIICFLACMARAGNSEDNTANIGKVSISGMVEVETAEMLKARMGTTGGVSATQTHGWNEHLVGTLNFEARPQKYLTLRGSFEFRTYSLYTPTLSGATYGLSDLVYNDFSLREAQGILSLLRNGSVPRVSIEMAIGLMPYKYNSEERNLGEFLFRSGTYPFFLNTEFDRPFARLTGLRGSLNYEDENFGAKLDILALTERESRPYWDFSFAAIGSLNFMKMVDIGAGVDLAHCISVDKNLTSPENTLTRYVKDSVYDAGLGTWQYNYGYYTFKGTKLMAHATIDPLGTIRGDKGSMVSEIAGENGGKIYGEWAIIGLENYPANNSNLWGYDKLKQKMPWMLGINIPLWKILDVCAFEIERYPSPSPNNPASIIKDGNPLPYFKQTLAYDTGSTYVPRWYWSLYLKKQIIKNFSIVCQMGRDHIRWEMPMNYQVIYYDYEEAMVKPDEWGWHIKMVLNF